jgi:hypothetical protein
MVTKQPRDGNPNSCGLDSPIRVPAKLVEITW